MRVFAPTRARIDRQVTRQQFFLDSCPYPVTYIVPEAERDAYIRRWPKSQEIVAVPDDWRLSDIRQWLVDDFHTVDPYHVCMDDDLFFLRRWAPTDIRQRSHGTKAAPITAEDAHLAFERMDWWLRQGYVHGALSQRGGNNTVEAPFKVIGRATDCHFYRADILHAEGIRINAVVLRQDFHTTLSLLELGYENVLDYEFMTGQSDGKPGGCQVYRTHELLEKEAHRLAELHPGFVKVIEKERKGGFGVSTDVRISWQKAYGSRREARRVVDAKAVAL